MEHFTKQLYTYISQAQKDMRDHATYKLRNNTLDLDTQVLLYKLPPMAYKQLDSANPSNYLPASVIEPQKISDVMTHYVRVIPNTGTRIDLYILDGEHCVKLQDPKKTADIIELYVRVLEQMSPVTQTTVTLVLLPTHHKKTINMNVAKILDETNVNTGVTFKSFDTRCIIVYRFEEMYKVILHELMHYYDFDYFEYSHDTEFSKQFKIESTKLGLNESFNDALTLCMYIGFYIAIKEQNRMKQLGTFIERYNNHFVHLRNYLIKMSAKLTLYSERHFMGVTKEKTHVFAYYHGKAALFANSRKFFMYLKRNNNKVPSDKTKDYVALLRSCLKSREYKTRLKAYHDTLEKTSSKFFMNTLRMCNYDLDHGVSFS